MPGSWNRRTFLSATAGTVGAGLSALSAANSAAVPTAGSPRSAAGADRKSVV